MASSGLRIAVLLIPLAVIGCRTKDSVRPGQHRGLVWLFPGVEGGEALMRPAINAFRDAGVAATIEVHDWQRAFGLVRNLVDHERNRADAGRIADRISRFQVHHPNDTVDLLGYSGGGGMAVMVAEALPEHVRVRNIILVQPAISTQYNLSGAIRHVDGSLVHFSSPLDALVLGAGTAAMGTMDRKHGASTGWLGLDLDHAVPDEDLRDKVKQITWSRSMIASGHWGGHMEMVGYAWNRRYVAPYLLRADNPESAAPLQPK